MANTSTARTLAAPIQLGSGNDTLAILISEDAWQGDAQFTITVDGQQIGGTQTATALHNAGQAQTFNIGGNFGSGKHSAAITFLNDAYAGTSATDRNLYVTGAAMNGAAVSNSTLALMSNGSQGFSFNGASPATSDTLDLHVSEDAWQGDAQFTVMVDGNTIGGVHTATALHAGGNTQDLSIAGNWGAGPHTIGIAFINDAYGGTATTDRNLFVDQVLYDGKAYGGAPAALYSNRTANFTAAVTTPVAPNPPVAVATGITRFYASTSFWNVPVAGGAAVDANSAAMVGRSILPYVGGANFANTDDWGIGLAYAHAGDKTYTVTGAIYYDTGPVSFRIPAGATPTTGDDHHLVVIDGAKELDLWQAHYDAASDSWTAGSRFVTDANGWGAMAAPGQRAGGAVAAGFAEMGGVVRPEEIAQGHIDHALSLTVPLVRAGFIAAPATATDGFSSDPASLPEGARLQLDPGFNVDAQGWPAWETVVAKALQTYGAYVSDRGGSVALYGQTDTNAGNASWAASNTPKGGSLANLPWDKMHVIALPNPS